MEISGWQTVMEQEKNKKRLMTNSRMLFLSWVGKLIC